jgi:glycosyltransferase involved in cell wall biosynthesis
MKVTFTFGGLPHYLIALLNKLVLAHGVDVSVIIPGKRGLTLGEGVKLGDEGNNYLFKVYRLDEFRRKFKKPYFRGLHRTLREISPDILVISWPYIINYYSDLASRKVLKEKNISLVFREIPFMVAPRNRAMEYYRKYPVLDENLRVTNPGGLFFYPWAFGLNLIRKRYYRLVDATLIYSTSGIEIQESFGISRENIFVTYNSPDTEKLAETHKELAGRGVAVSNPKRILHLGRLVKWKRVDLLIEAVALLSGKHETIELIIIGAGPEEENLRSVADQKDPGGKIRFLGAIYDPDVLAGEILSSAVYVLAGMGGLSINEAMAFGKPVICSRCDGTEKDLVSDGENGLFFKEGDAFDLAAKLDMLLSDPEKAQAMGEKALSVIQEKINLGTVAQKYMNCFSHVMRSKTGIS